MLMSVFLGVIIYFIGKRKNWARYLLLILFILAVLLAIKPLLQALSSCSILGIFEFVQSIAETVVIIFLFRRPARAWFKRRSS